VFLMKKIGLSSHFRENKLQRVIDICLMRVEYLKRKSVVGVITIHYFFLEEFRHVYCAWK